jgi:hypothetical protein
VPASAAGPALITSDAALTYLLQYEEYPRKYGLYDKYLQENMRNMTKICLNVPNMQYST